MRVGKTARNKSQAEFAPKNRISKVNRKASSKHTVGVVGKLDNGDRVSACGFYSPVPENVDVLADTQRQDGRGDVSEQLPNHNRPQGISVCLFISENGKKVENEGATSNGGAEGDDRDQDGDILQYGLDVCNMSFLRHDL